MILARRGSSRTGFILGKLSRAFQGLAFQYTSTVLNHIAYLLLSSDDCSAANCQRAIRLFAEYDLSVPRLLVGEELDKRFGWPAGSAQKTLNCLFDLGILVSLSHGRISAGGQTMWMISEHCSWTPRSLADQWERDCLLRDRAQGARIQPPTGHAGEVLKR
jgi:hypothetical protein